VILNLVLQRVGEGMRDGTVHRLLARPGDPLRPGSPLAEIRVDLGAAMAQDCPPVFHYRVVSTERGHLRAWEVAPGDTLEVGARLAVITTAPDEALEGPVARAIRTTSVVIQVDPLAG
jgi:pyruvate/2-oxoglutarate dehydrogenase complex dihydrolipoamide acyltransferase (E2) component